jgi:hypothetical protein
MTFPADQGRLLRALRGIASRLVELLGEVVFEFLLTVLACGILVGLAFAFVWGLARSPLATVGVAGSVLVFLGYGGWQLLRPAKRRRRGRLAGAAVVTFVAAVAVVAYASSCGCST